MKKIRFRLRQTVLVLTALTFLSGFKPVSYLLNEQCSSIPFILGTFLGPPQIDGPWATGVMVYLHVFLPILADGLVENAQSPSQNSSEKPTLEAVSPMALLPGYSEVKAGSECLESTLPAAIPNCPGCSAVEWEIVDPGTSQTSITGEQFSICRPTSNSSDRTTVHIQAEYRSNGVLRQLDRYIPVIFQ
ncbi:MAG: hypothetical protein JSU96_14180 [Acidobacteriota bacterium]|nr:MAG: hypothetical protein JSU96_14180 [Acidobacteriota bacterium]